MNNDLNETYYNRLYDDFIREHYHYMIMLYCIKNNISGNAGNLIQKRKSMDSAISNNIYNREKRTE
jgi:hypothetical protein